MRVDILKFDDCPHAGATVERVKRVAARLGVEIDINLIHVASHQDALRERFLGSPTVRVEGVDIDPSASTRSDFGLACRVYGREGTPPEAMIAAALTGERFHPGQSKSQGFALGGALVSAILSSACCWLPLIAVALGASAGGIAVAFEPHRPWFIGIAAVLLGFGIWRSERNTRRAQACGCPPPRGRVALNRAMLGLSALAILAFTLFPRYVDKVIGERGSTRAADAHVVTLHVEGMTCTGCESGIEAALVKLPGVTHADASYEGRTVAVGLDAAASVSMADMIGAVADAGYAATRSGMDSTAAPPAASIKVLKDDLRPLSRHFNRNATTTQFLAILSPT